MMGAPEGPLVRAAGKGEMPPWTVAGPERRAHIERVASLLATWADAAALSPEEKCRWVAAGRLHDALRDADPESLRKEVPPSFRGFPGKILHGPAAAARLEGQATEEMRQAIRYHTLGHPEFGALGKALYLADFLEPGREFDREWRASLAARVPDEMDEVLKEVLSARIRHLLDERKPISSQTAEFWSALVRGG